MKTLNIDNKNDGKKLITFLTSEFPSLNINYIYKALRKKDIKINGKRINENIVLHSSDILEVYISDDILYGAKNIVIPIIYEDDNIVIFDKPANLEVTGENSLTSIMKEKYTFLEPCHRIDRNTIGLVLFAKNLESLEILLDKFKINEIEKHYIACIYGNILKKADAIYSYLFKDNKKSIVYISDSKKTGYVPIKTSYKVLKENKKNKVSLLDVTLHTGKTHQIRAQLSHIGLPIIGDGKYGSYEINKKFHVSNQLLCSYSITFDFKSDSGILDYLSGMEIKLRKIPFENYLGDEKNV